MVLVAGLSLLLLGYLSGSDVLATAGGLTTAAGIVLLVLEAMGHSTS